jgi:cell division protein FtsI (penicillin-binding protein 3)
VDAEWKPSAKIQEQKVSYEILAKSPLLVMPDLDGLPGRDAVALLENNGVSVRIQGMGQVKAQSLVPGTPLVKGTTVQLTLE